MRFAGSERRKFTDGLEEAMCSPLTKLGIHARPHVSHLGAGLSADVRGIARLFCCQ